MNFAERAVLNCIFFEALSQAYVSREAAMFNMSTSGRNVSLWVSAFYYLRTTGEIPEYSSLIALPLNG